jgi:hypothetical protein
MQRSVAKILTTHVGSLPFLSLDSGIATGDAGRCRRNRGAGAVEDVAVRRAAINAKVAAKPLWPETCAATPE